MRSIVQRAASVLVTAFLLVALVGVSEVEAVPGSIVNLFDPDSDRYVGSPSITILPDGEYVASHSGFGSGHPALATYYYTSSDQGDSWAKRFVDITGDPLTENVQVGSTEATLFSLGGDFYSMGISVDEDPSASGNDTMSIRKWDDINDVWSEPDSTTTGRIGTVAPTGGGYSGDAAPVLIHNGRVWRSYNRVPTGQGANETAWETFVVSAPVGSDLLNSASWTESSSVTMSQILDPGLGMIEGNVVVDPLGNLKNVLRATGTTETAAFVDVSADGTTTTFNQASELRPFAGGASKFTIRFDNKTQKYWTLANDQTPITNDRSILTLNSSADLINWNVEGTIFDGSSDPANIGFQYADFQFDGSDIVAAVRTAFSGADNSHDANYLNFRRIRNYSSTSQVQSVTLDVSDDAEITNWVNWIDSPRGELAGGGNPPNYPGLLRVADQSFPTGAHTNDGWVLMKWDVSSLDTVDNSKLINNVDLRMIQNDLSVGDVEVYRINSGAWDEATVFWGDGNPAGGWVGPVEGDEDITLLGTMTGTQNNGFNKDGITHFSDSDLRNLVQQWVDGTQANHGILLKWPTTDPTEGDTYSSSENTFGHDPPQLIIDFIDRPAGDYNLDGVVDGADYTVWLDSLGSTTQLVADGNANLVIDQGDYDVWKNNFADTLGAISESGAGVPEPSTALLALAMSSLIVFRRNPSAAGR